MTNIKTCLTITLLIITSMKVSLANEEVVSAKCYIELFGGTKTVTGAAIVERNINQLMTTLIGAKIFVPGIEGKQTIYKVYECVSATKQFKDKLANRIYEKLPR